MRGGELHRLRKDAHKWKALGIGHQEAGEENPQAGL